MPHKSICPICGKLAFLHGKTIGDGTKLFWLCDECDRPFEVRFVTPEEFDKEMNEE